MAYFHGVRASEVPTSIVPPVQTTAGLPVVFGTAPVHLTENPGAYVNKPMICYSWKEAVSYFGYSADWQKYTLSEMMYAQFQLYNVAPIVLVNVLDPTKHKAAVNETTARTKNADGEFVVNAEVILSSLKVKVEADGEPVASTSYNAAYNDDGELIITAIEGGALENAGEIFLAYDKIDASLVTANDVIGGVSTDGKNKGLELLNDIFTLLGMVPGIVAAPGFSQIPSVASVMKAKALNISDLFRCIIVTDADTAQVTSYQQVNQWKNSNSYTGKNQIVCFPCVRNGDAIFRMSSHIVGIIGATDARNSDVPYQSPSNAEMQATGLCLANGEEVTMSLTQANLLNSQGIMTAINLSGGWKSWGNYTGAYPGTTDVKDTFICVRRMFDWQYQTFILTYWQKVDQPLMPRLIKTIVDSEIIRLNGLVARGFLLGADVKFLESENPLTDLMQGIIRIHSYITPPVPAQEIEDILEYDVNNFKTLFEAVG